MAASGSKKAVPATPAPATKPHALAALVDELGALEVEMAPYAMKIAKIEMLRRAIRAHYGDANPGLACTAEGSRFTAHVGPCGNKTDINLGLLARRIGAKLYQQISTVTLASLEKHCAPEIVAAVAHVQQTGPRPLKLFERSAPVEKG